MFWAVKWPNIDIEMGIPKCESQKTANTLKRILESLTNESRWRRKRFDGGM